MLAAEPLVRWEWIPDHWDDIREATTEHLQLTGSSVAIGFVIAMAMAMISIRWRFLYGPLAALSAGSMS